METLPDRWTLTLDAPNLLRVTFGADKCGAVEVREALRGVRIVLRDNAPMFGAPDAPGAAWDQPFWTPPRDPTSRPGLLASAWIESPS